MESDHSNLIDEKRSRFAAQEIPQIDTIIAQRGHFQMDIIFRADF